MMRLDLSESRHCCLTCGSHVSSDFARVYGDRDGRVHRCPVCDSVSRLTRGTSAGKEIKFPDPLDHPRQFVQPVDELPSRLRSLIEERRDDVAADGGDLDGE